MLALDIPLSKSFTDRSLEKCAEDLKSLLIVSFETAIDEGLPPREALAIVLGWAADECARLKSAAAS